MGINFQKVDSGNIKAAYLLSLGLDFLRYKWREETYIPQGCMKICQMNGAKRLGQRLALNWHSWWQEQLMVVMLCFLPLLWTNRSHWREESGSLCYTWPGKKLWGVQKSLRPSLGDREPWTCPLTSSSSVLGRDHISGSGETETDTQDQESCPLKLSSYLCLTDISAARRPKGRLNLIFSKPPRTRLPHSSRNQPTVRLRGGRGGEGEGSDSLFIHCLSFPGFSQKKSPFPCTSPQTCEVRSDPSVSQLVRML